MAWGDWVTTEVMYKRASGRRAHNKRRQEATRQRRDQVRQLVQRWGDGASVKLRMSRALGVSLRTILRDVRALRDAPAPPLICDACGLPSRLDVTPAEWAALTDDPVTLARLERAFARLVGVADPPPLPKRRTRALDVRSPQPAGALHNKP